MPHAAYEDAGFDCHQTWTNTLRLTPDLARLLRATGQGRPGCGSPDQTVGGEAFHALGPRAHALATATDPTVRSRIWA